MNRRFGLAGLALCVLASATTVSAITIDLRYDYDTAGFFTPEVRARMQEAANAFAGFTDQLSAIVPDGMNTWEAQFSNPETGAGVSISNLTVPADTVIVFVGSRNIGSLGVGGPGGWSASGFQPWFDLLEGRGQAGALGASPTDYALWGGAITFDRDANWHFGSGAVPFAQYDFFSVALHEMAHVFGFGLAGSWDEFVQAGPQFAGPDVMALIGGPAALSGNAHWATGTTSTANGADQTAVMVPALVNGERRFFTALDYAAMSDIGWEVPVPEPGSFLLLVGGALLLASRRSRA